MCHGPCGGEGTPSQSGHTLVPSTWQPLPTPAPPTTPYRRASRSLISFATYASSCSLYRRSFSRCWWADRRLRSRLTRGGGPATHTTVSGSLGARGKQDEDPSPTQQPERDRGPPPHQSHHPHTPVATNCAGQAGRERGGGMWYRRAVGGWWEGASRNPQKRGRTKKQLPPTPAPHAWQPSPAHCIGAGACATPRPRPLDSRRAVTRIGWGAGGESNGHARPTGWQLLPPTRTASGAWPPQVTAPTGPGRQWRPRHPPGAAASPTQARSQMALWGLQPWGLRA